MLSRYNTAYDEALEFLSSPQTPDDVLGFKLSAETKSRIRELLEKRRENSLTAKDAAELQAFQDIAVYLEMRKRQASRYHH